MTVRRKKNTLICNFLCYKVTPFIHLTKKRMTKKGNQKNKYISIKVTQTTYSYLLDRMYAHSSGKAQFKRHHSQSVE